MFSFRFPDKSAIYRQIEDHSTFTPLTKFLLLSNVAETMKKHIDILLEEFETDDDLLKILPSVSAQVVKDVNEHLSDKAKPQLPEAAAKNLEEQGRKSLHSDREIGCPLQTCKDNCVFCSLTSNQI